MDGFHQIHEVFHPYNKVILENEGRKMGMSIIPVKFEPSMGGFKALMQGSAYVRIFKDGTVFVSSNKAIGKALKVNPPELKILLSLDWIPVEF